MSTLRAAMTPDPLTIAADARILDAVALLVSRRISGLPVVDAQGALVGMLTSRDCFRAALEAGYHGDTGGLVHDYMTAPVQTLDIDTDMFSAAQRFVESPCRRFPVTEQGRMVGILSRGDLLRALGAA